MELVGLTVGNPMRYAGWRMWNVWILAAIGPEFEFHPRFMPHRVNTEFIQILDRKNIRMGGKTVTLILNGINLISIFPQAVDPFPDRRSGYAQLPGQLFPGKKAAPVPFKKFQKPFLCSHGLT